MGWCAARFARGSWWNQAWCCFALAMCGTVGAVVGVWWDNENKGQRHGCSCVVVVASLFAEAVVARCSASCSGWP